jgi:hypothetical protein
MTAVWLWDASRWSGVCGDAAAARGKAAALLRSGEASEATVEEASLAVGTALDPSYQRTGRAWRATAGGRVTWAPLAA